MYGLKNKDGFWVCGYTEDGNLVVTNDLENDFLRVWKGPRRAVMELKYYDYPSCAKSIKMFTDFEVTRIMP